MNNKLVQKKRRCIAVVTSIHPDFDKRVWKHAKSLAQYEQEVHLVCPWKISDGVEVDGVVLHSFKRIKRRWQRFFLIPWRVFGTLKHLLTKVDLVHFHDLDMLPWMALLSFIKPTVYDVHENYADDMLNKEYIPKPFRLLLYYLLRWGQFMLSVLVHNVVYVASYQESSFRHHRINTIKITNYASLELIDHVTNDYADRCDAVVYIGAQHLNNGGLLLIEIAEHLKKECPNINFYISDNFNRPGFRKIVFDEIKKRKLDGFIKLIPYVRSREIMKVLNQGTIAISPNLRVPEQINGIHTKLFEYMAAGLPIVASDLPHQAEVIEDSNCGLLAQPENVDSFVQAIKKLVSDRKLAMNLGQNGQQAFIKHYSWESQIPLLLDFYGKLLSK